MRMVVCSHVELVLCLRSETLYFWFSDFHGGYGIILRMAPEPQICRVFDWHSHSCGTHLCRTSFCWAFGRSHESNEQVSIFIHVTVDASVHRWKQVLRDFSKGDSLLSRTPDSAKANWTARQTWSVSLKTEYSSEFGKKYRILRYTKATYPKRYLSENYLWGTKVPLQQERIWAGTFGQLNDCLVTLYLQNGLLNGYITPSRYIRTSYIVNDKMLEL